MRREVGRLEGLVWFGVIGFVGGWGRDLDFRGWRIKSKKIGLFPVRQALGQSFFVGVRQSRWQYVVLMAQDSTTLFHWSWAGVK